MIFIQFSIIMEMKKCKFCSSTHPKTKEFFYVVPRPSGIPYFRCKVSHKAKSDKYRRTHKKYIMEYRRNYDKTDKSRESKRRSHIKIRKTILGVANAIVDNSKQGDILFNRYQEVGFITKEWCLAHLQNPDLKCHYCGGTMLFGGGVNRLTSVNTDGHHNGLSIERLDNKLCHLQTNCVFACVGHQGINRPIKGSNKYPCVFP